MDPWKWNLTPTQFPYPHQSHLFPQDTPNPSFQSAQLTMFYDGEVMVFDNIPAEKVKDIMSFATSQSQTNNGYACTFPATVVTTTSASSIRKFPFHVNMFPATPNNSDLPLARKASLHRFLEKRKDRIAARAPYQTSNSVDALNKAPESLAWLALTPKSPQDESESSSSSELF